MFVNKGLVSSQVKKNGLLLLNKVVGKAKQREEKKI